MELDIPEGGHRTGQWKASSHTIVYYLTITAQLTLLLCPALDLSKKSEKPHCFVLEEAGSFLLYRVCMAICLVSKLHSSVINLLPNAEWKYFYKNVSH